MQNFIRRQSCLRHATFFLAGLIASAGSEAAEITFETRALTGTDGPLGPGLGAGVSFSRFTVEQGRALNDSPVINRAGQTAFFGMLTGPGVTSLNSFGIWSDTGGGGLALVARAGNQAPGMAAGIYLQPVAPLHNDAGQPAIYGQIFPGTGVAGSNNAGVWSENGGEGLALVAVSGNQAPGTAAGVNFRAIVRPAHNTAGQTAFLGALTGLGVTSANDDGIWSDAGEAGLALVARQGNQTPSMAEGVNFGVFGFPLLNNAGQLAFVSGFYGPEVTLLDDSGIWSDRGGAGLALIVREGDHAPGTAPEVKFGGFSLDSLNSEGQVAFQGHLVGDGVTSANNYGIWSEGGGAGLALIARAGNQAPGTTPGVNFGFFGATTLLNDAGQIAFHGQLTGTEVTSANDKGIWSDAGGSGLALVARTGNQAPGTAPGVNFSGNAFAAPVLNNAGQTAFNGSLTGPGVNNSNSIGIWATDTDGQLQLIARSGDLINVSNDPLNPNLRTISRLWLAGQADLSNRLTVFNDAGQLALWLRFTDGSEGIFVATIGGLSATPFKVTITPAIAPATGYDFAWESLPGKVYDLVTSTDPVTPVAQWPVHASYSDIPATGTTTTLTAVPVDGPQRFFAVIEKDAPSGN